MYFNESLLEESFKTLFENEGYIAILVKKLNQEILRKLLLRKT